MIPVEIDELDMPEDATCRVYAKGQSQYIQLPVVTMGGDDGVMVSCWQLSSDEVQQVVRTGKVYLAQMTFNSPLQPVLLTTSLEEALRVSV